MKSMVHSFHTGITSAPKEEASQQQQEETQETQGKTNKNKNKKPDENPTCVLEWTTITLDQFH